jgi:aminoglycoside phosphotransferase (APT) family kinase protein
MRTFVLVKQVNGAEAPAYRLPFYSMHQRVSMRTFVLVKQVNGAAAPAYRLPFYSMHQRVSMRTFVLVKQVNSVPSQTLEHLQVPSLAAPQLLQKKKRVGGEARRVQPPQRQYLYFCTSKAVFVLLY